MPVSLVPLQSSASIAFTCDSAGPCFFRLSHLPGVTLQCRVGGMPWGGGQGNDCEQLVVPPGKLLSIIHSPRTQPTMIAVDQESLFLANTIPCNLFLPILVVLLVLALYIRGGIGRLRTFFESIIEMPKKMHQKSEMPFLLEEIN